MKTIEERIKEDCHNRAYHIVHDIFSKVQDEIRSGIGYINSEIKMTVVGDDDTECQCTLSTHYLLQIMERHYHELLTEQMADRALKLVAENVLNLSQAQ